jgi:DNA-binding response OmpR family regulator
LKLDLIFLDLMMPQKNGFEVLEALRERDDNIPVIILSALSRKETVLKAMSYGIKSYLIKPLKPEEVFSKAVEVFESNF